MPIKSNIKIPIMNSLKEIVVIGKRKPIIKNDIGDYPDQNNGGMLSKIDYNTVINARKTNPNAYKGFEVNRDFGHVPQMATGGELQQQNNSSMNPYLYNSLPQYGLGSWLAENAGTIGSVAGGIGGFLIGGPAGAALGSSALGGVGNMITKGHEQGEMNDQQAANVAMQQQQMDIKNATSNYQAQQHPMYGTNFAVGGFMPNVNTWQYSNVGGINYAEGGGIHINPENVGKFNATKERTGKTTEELTHSSNPLTRKRAIFAQNAAKWHHEDGGYLMSGRPEATIESNNNGNDNSAAQMTKGLDNITVYPKSAGSHQTSSTNGIPIGNKGLVEGGETRIGKYIFSNRF